MAAGLAKHLGEPVSFTDLPFEVFAGFGFPGADDMANMFHVQALYAREFEAVRDPRRARELHPGMLNFDAWLAQNISRIPIG